MNARAEKNAGIEWLCRVYSGDREAVGDAEADRHLFDRSNDFGLKDFVESFRPLKKLRDAKGDVNFTIGEVEHRDPDRSFAQLVFEGEVVFILVVRFEEVAPHRVKYWMSHPPLPEGLEIRPYQATDAQGCVALERSCPMEMLDGTQWIVDRGERFDDYLRLMDGFDAAVVVSGDQVVGFYSCALRPIQYENLDSYCVYQHHYRVHPDHRAGSVSQALATYVDPRRTFERFNVQFPYSLIDPDNAHMQTVGFPVVEGVKISRLSIALAEIEEVEEASPQVIDAETICSLINQTHGERSLFRHYTAASLQERTQKIGSYSMASFVGDASAVLGVWLANESNVMVRDGVTQEHKLAFVLDYGFKTVSALIERIRLVAPSLRDLGATHLCILCDQRAEEYEVLQSVAVDEQVLAIHTLPWTMDAFAATTTYCDAVYC